LIGALGVKSGAPLGGRSMKEDETLSKALADAKEDERKLLEALRNIKLDLVDMIDHINEGRYDFCDILETLRDIAEYIDEITGEETDEGD
jgi:hypothetical protein